MQRMQMVIVLVTLLVVEGKALPRVSVLRPSRWPEAMGSDRRRDPR